MASIRKLPSGRYRVRWRDPDGAERGRTFARAKEARQFKIDTEHAAIRGMFRDPKAGRQAFGPYVLEQLDRAELQPATRALYLSVARNHVIPRLGNQRLAGITRADLSRLYALLRDEGVGAQTIKVVHRLVSRTFSEAVADGDVEANPAWRVKTPKARRLPPRTLTEEEIIRIAVATRYLWAAPLDPFREDDYTAEASRLVTEIQHAENAGQASLGWPDSAGLLVLMAGYSGLRFGELAALRRDRVHTGGRPFIEVVEAAAEVAGKVTIGETKTEGSRRAVPIPHWLAGVFRRYVPSGNQLAFSTPRGHVWSRTRFRARVWVPAVAIAEVQPAPNFHDLRHSYASRLISQGLNPKVIQTRMGHSSIRTTFDLYGHLMPDDDVARTWHGGESEDQQDGGSREDYVR